MKEIQKIRYINCCIQEFAKKFKLSPKWAHSYLHTHRGIYFLDKCYEGEHLLSLNDAVSDLAVYCRRHGGTL